MSVASGGSAAKSSGKSRAREIAARGNDPAEGIGWFAAKCVNGWTSVR